MTGEVQGDCRAPRAGGGARQPERTTRAVARWHAVLAAFALLNLTLWSLTALGITRAQATAHANSLASPYVQLLLSAMYVSGCAFRSVLPVYDIPRLVLIDSRLSSVMVGRSVATVAELCFATQWALILHRIGLWSGSLLVQAAAVSIVPLIGLAQLCCWYAVLTTAQRQRERQRMCESQ